MFESKSDVIAEQAAEIDSLRAQIEAFEAGLTSLRSYLESPKFESDPTVQTADIFARLAEIRSAVIDEQFVPRGLASAVRKDRYYPNGLVADYSRKVRHAN